MFRCQPNGLRNKDLRALTAELRRLDPAAVTAGPGHLPPTTTQIPRGLISRIPGTHRYRVTDHGLHTAKSLTTVHDRLLPTGLTNSPTPITANSRQQPSLK
jgi:hypothetical protein